MCALGERRQPPAGLGMDAHAVLAAERGWHTDHGGAFPTSLDGAETQVLGCQGTAPKPAQEGLLQSQVEAACAG